jgi:Domain of unknown function (DUF4424)
MTAQRVAGLAFAGLAFAGLAFAGLAFAGLAFAGLAFAGLAFVEGRALANDSEALLAGGEITFKRSEGISMESEDLSIKPDEVRVAYRFHNTTASDITTRVAFPLAPYELPDEDDQAESDTALQAEPRWRDLGHFTLRVDGQSVPFESTVKWSAKKVAGRREDQKIVTVTYHWMQTFPAGKVVSVEHSFHPYGGFIYSFAYDGAALERQLTHDYCVGPVLLRAMRAGEGSLNQVHYILKTGANWSGPIGRFTLRIQKARATDKVSVCLDGLRKVDDRTFILERTNYVPIQDLQIAFITLPER